MKKTRRMVSFILSLVLLLQCVFGEQFAMGVRAGGIEATNESLASEAEHYDVSTTDLTLNGSGYNEAEIALSVRGSGQWGGGESGWTGRPDDPDSHLIDLAIDFSIYGGTLTNANGGTIPFLVGDNTDDTASESASFSMRLMRQVDSLSFDALIYVDPAAYEQALPGTYVGTLPYELRQNDGSDNGEPETSTGSINVTLVVPIHEPVYQLDYPEEVALQPFDTVTALTINVTQLVSGFDSEGKETKSLRMILNAGSLVNQADSSKTIPFLISTLGNPMSQRVMDWSAANVARTLNVCIDANTWDGAAPGTYKGAITYSLRWKHTDNTFSGDFATGSIPVTVEIIPVYDDITISFDAQGGTAAITEANTAGGKLLSLPEATREGLSFSGWYTAPTGGERVTTETKFTGDATVYAHWYGYKLECETHPDEDEARNAIYVDVTELYLAEDESGKTIDGLRMIINGGTLVHQEDSSQTIPFKILTKSVNPASQRVFDWTETNDLRLIQTYIAPSDIAKAASGVYQGAYTYSLRWRYTDRTFSGDIATGSIPITIEIPARHAITITCTGNGSAQYTSLFGGAEGEEISITATPEENNMFIGWRVLAGDVIIKNPNLKTTTFLMGSSDVTIEAVFAEDHEYSVTLHPGDGGGTPVTFWAKNQAVIPDVEEAENLQFYDDDGNMGFKLSQEELLVDFTAPDGYRFGGWSISSTYYLFEASTYHMDATALWVLDQTTMGDAECVLTPTAFELTGGGFNDIQSTVTELVLGKICNILGGMSSYQQVTGVDLFYYGGTLTDSTGKNKIPFLVDNEYHFEPSSVAYSAHTIREQDAIVQMAVYIDPTVYDQAAPGTYTGTLIFERRWQVMFGSVSDKTGTIALTLVIPESDEFYDITVTSVGRGMAYADRTKGKEGTVVTLTAVPSAGCYFKGWQVVSGEVTISEDTFIMPSTPVEIKAIFEEIVITFDAGEGTVTPASAKTLGGKLTSIPEAVREGWTFEGWYTEKAGGSKVTTETVFDKDATVYARWHKEVTVTFDPLDGTVSPASMETVHGMLPTMPTAVKDDWVLEGWYTEETGGSKVTASTVFDNDCVLYAHWIKVSAYEVEMPDNVVISPFSDVTEVPLNATKLRLISGTDGRTPYGLRISMHAGTLVNQADNEKTIPFLLKYEADALNNAVQIITTFTDAGSLSRFISISSSGWEAATPGTYVGAISYKIFWYYERGGISDDLETGTIPVTVTIPEGARKSITVTQGKGGTANASAAYGVEGSEIALTATPEEGYVFKEWQVVSGGVTIDNPYGSSAKFTVGTDDVEIKAVFVNVEDAARAISIATAFKGKFQMNFYLYLPESLISDEGAYAMFTGGYADKKIALSSLTGTETEDGIKYKLSYNVYAKEVRDKITLRLYYGNGDIVTIVSATGTKNYTATGIETTLLSYLDYCSGLSDEKTVALAEAAKNYCTAAQIYFGYKAEGLSFADELEAVTEETLSPYEAKITGTMPKGVSIDSISAVIEADNSFRLYLKYDGTVEPKKYKYYVNGTAVKLKSSGAKYYLEVKNVGSNHLDDDVKFTITRGTKSCDVTVSVLTYARSCLLYGNGNVIKLAKALYLYNQAAVAKFGK